MIAVQTKVGAIREKATTELSLDFDSMVSVNGFEFGANSDGIYLMNTGDDDVSTTVTRTLTFATSDLGIKNFKHVRFLYLGVSTDNDFTVSVKYDRGTFSDYPVSIQTTGLQYVRVPVAYNQQGRYVTIKITATHYLVVDSVEAVLITRPAGVAGY